jgi:hypothetical protein
VVTLIRRAGQARFVVEQIDAYGNPTPVSLSAPFPAPRTRLGRPTSQAKATYKQLVERMEADGWKLVGVARSEWYAMVFELRPEERKRSGA